MQKYYNLSSAERILSKRGWGTLLEQGCPCRARRGCKRACPFLGNTEARLKRRFSPVCVKINTEGDSLNLWEYFFGSSFLALLQTSFLLEQFAVGKVSLGCRVVIFALWQWDVDLW